MDRMFNVTGRPVRMESKGLYRYFGCSGLFGEGGLSASLPLEPTLELRNGDVLIAKEIGDLVDRRAEDITCAFGKRVTIMSE